MSDVDTVRLLASEYNLEFVDLDRYNLDPSVAGVVTPDMAREHHVVPIGRKFGAPVIAISDPADVFTLDTLRTNIGRDFIAVVADADQIESVIERVYSGSSGSPGASVDGNEGVALLDGIPVGDASGGEADLLSSALDDALGMSIWGAAFAAGAAPAQAEPQVTPVAQVAEPEVTESLIAEPPAMDQVGPEPQVTPVAQVAEPEVTEPPEAKVTEAKVTEAKVTEAPGTTGVAPPIPPFPSANGSAEAEVGDMPTAVPDYPEYLQPGEDDTAAAADLVETAVAEFEQSGGAVFAPEGAASDEDLGYLPPLARALVEGGRVLLADMQAVVAEHAATGQSIARLLTARGLVTEADLMWGMASEMGLEFVDLDMRMVDAQAAYRIPEATARHHNVLVIGLDSGVPVVAASNPTDVLAMDDIRTILGRSFVTVVATRSQISSYIDRAYGGGGDAETVARSAAIDLDLGTDSQPELTNIQVVDDAPIIRYVNLLVLQALNERASDIHVEPSADHLRIRYRVDGVLHDMSTAPRSIAGAVTTRLKVMADMNIAEHRIPQDGRISVNVGTRQIDLRMATLPTIHGEKIVMRVLDKSSVVLSLDELGFDPELHERFREVYTKPYGTILVTGPTGSGKTTTLYATLSDLNSPEKNIITVEDPVELQIKGISQIQLNVKAGLTFASALRAILRADPDIVLVGEIRDRETALISVEAAMTGHLVLATLHTNDAASTPMRLVEMGLEPYLVTSAVSAVVAQRLARRLCVHCKEPFEATEADIVAAGWKPEELRDAAGDSLTFYRAMGCPACSNTGYRGRSALLELLVMSEEIERTIIEGGSVDAIHRLAVELGMVPLRAAGLRKAIAGETTLEEVLRVVA
ncbi:MAG: GspE/PulE family protein [Acidimicrobiales bacterium]